MKIIIIKDKLKEAVDAVSRVTGDHPTLSVLKHILIEATNEGIVLTGTNLEVGMQYKVPGKVEKEGSITVPGNVLSQLLGALREDRITFETMGDTLDVTAGNYSAKIQGGPAEEFPLIPKVNTENADAVEVPGNTLKDALEEVLAASQYSELRPELNAVFVRFTTDKMVLVATDSFRLAEKTLNDSEFTSEGAEEFQMLLPLKSAQEVMRLARQGSVVKMFKEENQVLFSTSEAEFISRLIDGNFPDYQAIIPREFQAECFINREELMDAVKLAGVMGGQGFEVVMRAKGDKEIEIWSRDEKLGENTSAISAKIQGEFDERSFNGKYLLDGLRVLEGKEITLNISEENRPAMLKSPRDASFFYIVMPILKG